MITAIKRKITDLWERKTAFHTNFFIADRALIQWNNEHTLHYYTSADSLLILHDNQDFFQGYIVTINMQDAKKLLCDVSSQVRFPISMDIVGTNNDLSALMESVGFRQKATLQRMTRLNTTKITKANFEPSISYATATDIDLLMHLLAQDFDPLIKQLPAKDELIKLLNENNIIFTHTSSGEISGYLIAEQIGITMSLRFVDVLPPYRRQGLGKLLINAFLSLKDNIKKHQLWVKKDNTAAIHLYQNYDFNYDGLNDNIYVWEANR